ncbi:MAG: LysR family transcriptional regulator [Oscillospiraceae bacterium]|nr:LysR family transcriptional regulator [Oscillospiraceae bacterium]
MYVSCDYYRVFYYVAKYGSISQAAKLLLNNQPNLTRTIKNLEGELGCPLFFRSNRGMRLTPEGEKLYSHLRIAFEHIEAGEAEIIGSRNLENGSVFVAASEIALHCLLLPVLKKYRELYPGVRVRIGNHTAPQAAEAVKDGTADLAVVASPTVKFASLTEKNLRTLRQSAACGNAFPELLGRTVPLKTLTEYPLISLAPETKSYEFYSEYFAENGLHYQPDIIASTSDQILPMVEADLGIGFVPEQLMQLTASRVGLHEITLDPPLPDREICLIKRRDQPLSIAARELEKLILKVSD